MRLIQRIKQWAARRRFAQRATRARSPSTQASVTTAQAQSGGLAAAESGGVAEPPRSMVGLTRITSLAGVDKAALIRGSKAVVSGAIRDGRDPFLRIVRVTAKSAHRFARRNGLGNAAETVMEGGFGCICVCVRGDALAAAQTSSRAQVGAVLEQLQELVSGAVGALEVSS